MENFSPRNEKTKIERGRATPSSAQTEFEPLIKHTKEINSVKEIEQEELQERVSNFLKYKGYEANDTNIQSIILLIGDKKAINRDFDVYDLEENEIDFVLDSKEGRKQLDTFKSEVQTHHSFVEDLKSQGFPNTIIIQEVLKASQIGTLQLPQAEKDKYQNFLALTQNDFGQDNSKIEEIINKTDLEAENSFDIAIESILEDKTISVETKEWVVQEFRSNIGYLKMGSEVKDTLLAQQKEKEVFAEQIKELDSFIENTGNQIKELEKQITSLKSKLHATMPYEERMQLESRIEQLETDLDGLIAEQEKRKQNKIELEEQSPNDSIVMRNTNAFVEGDSIVMQHPTLSKRIRIPLAENGESIGETINSYFVFASFQKYQLDSFVFEGDVLTENDSLSPQMRTQCSQILSLLNIGNVGEILSLQDLKVLDKAIQQLRTEENGSIPKSKEKAKMDLMEKGILDSEGNILKKEFYGWLEAI